MASHAAASWLVRRRIKLSPNLTSPKKTYCYKGVLKFRILQDFNSRWKLPKRFCKTREFCLDSQTLRGVIACVLGFHPPMLVLAGGVYLFKLTCRLHHLALRSRDGCASSGTRGNGLLSVGISVPPLGENPFPSGNPFLPTMPLGGSPDFCRYWLVGRFLASLQEMHSGASNLLLGLKTSCRLTLIDDYGKSRLGYWLLLCFKDHRAYWSIAGRHSVGQRWVSRSLELPEERLPLLHIRARVRRVT